MQSTSTIHFFAQYIILIPVISWFIAVIFKGFYGLHMKSFSLSQTL